MPSAFNVLPKYGGGTGPNGVAAQNWAYQLGNISVTGPPVSNSNDNLSIFVGLTPFIEQQALWEQINNPYMALAPDGTPVGLIQKMGLDPQATFVDVYTTLRYEPWLTELPVLRCPSDPGVGLPAKGRTNYAACLGGAIDRTHRGVLDSTGLPNDPKLLAEIRLIQVVLDFGNKRSGPRLIINRRLKNGVDSLGHWPLPWRPASRRSCRPIAKPACQPVWRLGSDGDAR